MSATTTTTIAAQRHIETPSGRIACREQGTGWVAHFVHGVRLLLRAHWTETSR